MSFFETIPDYAAGSSSPASSLASIAGYACVDECSAGQTKCAGQAKQSCGDYDTSDSCLEWGGGVNCPYGCAGGVCSACTPTPAPSPGTICSGQTVSHSDGCGETTQVAGTKNCAASLSASYVITNIAQNNPYKYYYYYVTLLESAGIGVSITSGKRCFSPPDPTGCINYSPNFYIPPNGEVTRSNQYFYTQYIPNIVTYTYSGTDTNGNPVSVSFTINVS